MGRIQVVLSDELEMQLRQRTLKKGDISRIVEEALANWLNKQKGERSV